MLLILLFAYLLVGCLFALCCDRINGARDYLDAKCVMVEEHYDHKYTATQIRYAVYAIMIFAWLPVLVMPDKKKGSTNGEG